MPFRTFFNKLRPASAEDLEALSRYRECAGGFVTRAQTIRDDWVALREVEPEFERLANSAAVNRWEILRLCRQMEDLDPPRGANGVHRDLYTTMGDSARACQLLANGYRFHKSEAVCDGQYKLVE